jgi:hypothetical protein
MMEIIVLVIILIFSIIYLLNKIIEIENRLQYHVISNKIYGDFNDIEGKNKSTENLT